MLVIFLKSSVSSANFNIWLLMLKSMSFMKIKNKIGPMTEPCGTPLSMVNQSDNVPRRQTL